MGINKVDNKKILKQLLDNQMDTLIKLLSDVKVDTTEEDTYEYADFHYDGEGTPLFNNGYPSLELAKKVDAFLKTYGEKHDNSKINTIREKFYPYLLLLQKADTSLECLGFISSVLAKYPDIQIDADIKKEINININKELEELNLRGGLII